LLAFTENKAQEFKYSPEDKLPSETLDLFIICDADVDQKRWIARLYRVHILIIEVLQTKGHFRGGLEFIEKSLEKFPKNPLMMTYHARAKLFRGD